MAECQVDVVQVTKSVWTRNITFYVIHVESVHRIDFGHVLGGSFCAETELANERKVLRQSLKSWINPQVREQKLFKKVRKKETLASIK